MRKWLLAITLLLACHRTPPATKTGRVVSLSPSTTEAVYAVGAELVGRSRYCDYPPEVKKLPEIGGYVDPSFEAILALHPSLVVGARGPAGSAIADRLAANGIATFFPETESFAAIDAMILGVGERTGHAEDGKKQVAMLHDRIATIEADVAGLPRTRVLMVFGLAPLSVAGPGSFADEMLRRAGGANVVTEGGAYPTMGVERVLALDPDLIINAAMMEEGAAERLRKDAPAGSRVRAVTTDHVVALNDEVVLRPGPRIGEGLGQLAKALHPGSPLAGRNEGAAVKARADQLLVTRGLAPTRAKAQALILAGKVYAGEARIDKAGALVADDAAIAVRGEDHPYVSRGGVKLAGALDAFAVDPAGKRCLDLGASTGGFTDCLLQRGAASVAAVDVGYGQLAHSLRVDPRVLVLERTNARELQPSLIGGGADLVVVDASFIGLGKLIEGIARCTRTGGELVALVKPQFEVGREEATKARGVVKDPEVRARAIAAAVADVATAGFTVLGTVDCVLPGPKGNVEAFVHARRDGTEPRGVRAR